MKWALTTLRPVERSARHRPSTRLCVSQRPSRRSPDRLDRRQGWQSRVTHELSAERLTLKVCPPPFLDLADLVGAIRLSADEWLDFLQFDRPCATYAVPTRHE